MALPKRRWSTHRQGKKRKSLGIKLPNLVSCPNCGALTLPHRVCAFCAKNENAQRSKAPKKKKSD